ncbi:hypothetical protein CPB85DRAFT_1251692 [Mucidula mucida]|nr:hypothetical protein CPB85DRAFT_1251692 [Mucidula mucida]
MVAIIPSPSFWFEDGNIVLIAESIASKVHRGQLARQSEVFEGMFGLPMTPDATETYDGCPSVCMYGDTASDWTFFLTALYDGLYFTNPRKNDFPIVAAVVRLSTKYLVDPLRIRSIARLEIDYPPTLEAWDYREQSAVDDEGLYSPRHIYAHPIPVIQIAIELGLSGVLPAAFYDLSRYGPSKIIRGTGVSGERYKLPIPLFARILRGRELAQEFMAHFILSSRSPADMCLTPALCSRAFYFISLNLLRAIGGVAPGRDADPLYMLSQAIEMLEREDFEVSPGGTPVGLSMCLYCKVVFSQECMKKREEAWQCMPEWFGLRGDDRPI